jgi:hypothetical protein
MVSYKVDFLEAEATLSHVSSAFVETRIDTNKKKAVCKVTCWISAFTKAISGCTGAVNGLPYMFISNISL